MPKDSTTTTRKPALSREQKAEARAAAAAAKTDNGAADKLAANDQAGVRTGQTNARAAKPERASKYDDEVRDSVRRAKAIRGKPDGVGPKQHAQIRKVVDAELKGNVTPETLATLAGFKSPADLRKVAEGKGDRTATKPLGPLAAKMGDDPYTKGRYLAVALAARIEQITQKG